MEKQEISLRDRTLMYIVLGEAQLSHLAMRQFAIHDDYISGATQTRL